MAYVNPRVKLTYNEYVCFPPDGKRHEIIDGDHFMNPAPSTNHQRVLQRIQVQLFLVIEEAGLGRVFPAPTDVHLSEHDVVQPDIIAIRESRTNIITPTKIKGAPDLLVEILSPSTRKVDLELKRKLYEREGVGEYWIVHPDEHTLTQLVLNDGAYQERSHGDTFELNYFDGVTIDLSRVWPSR